MTTTAPARHATPRPGPAGVRVVGDEQPRRLGRTTLDDRLTLAGAAFGSASLVWVLYNQVLPVAGVRHRSKRDIERKKRDVPTDQEAEHPGERQHLVVQHPHQGSGA